MEFFKRAAIGIIIGLALLTLVFSGIFKMDDKVETKALTIYSETDISINARRVAYQPMLIAPYKTMDIFISNEESPGFEFTSVGGSWEEVLPPGTNIQAEVRVKVDGEWSDWMELHEEEDLIQNKKYAMASSNPATAMQYKYILYGDGISTPMVKNVDWTFIRSGKNISLKKAPNPKYSSIKPVSNTTYLALNKDPSGVISREQWGADESYRYLSNNDIDPVLVEVDPDWYEKFKDELQYSRVVKKDENGDKYRWPLQYPTEVKKLIIHHTATTSNLDNPEQAIRDIYYYHAITRGWGDIGYNYIMDTEENIYEGRYGGEGVIGAHAGLGNNGSIGISVLGDYENNPVPEKIIGVLGEFIGKKAKIHGIDPDAYSDFRGQLMPNVFGHKDIMNTNCPGAYLYEKFPIIRSIAAQYSGKKKEKFVKDYDFQDESELYYIELKPDETVDVTIKMENIGKVDWNNETFIVVDKNPVFEGVISFPGSGEVVLAMMEENLVKPGETATFKFKIKAAKKGDIVYMNITPLMNGFKKNRDYIVLPVSVQQVDYKYEFVDSLYPDKAMEKGEEFSGWVKLKNTGNITWRKTGENTVVLGTDHERDRKTKFVSPADTRIGYLEEDEVAPGETGTFLMNLKAPQDPGYYKEYFTPIVEGITWMADSGMYFETVVFGDRYATEVVKITASKEWERNGKYLIKIKLRNLGQVTWTTSNLKLYFIRETDLKVSDARLLTKSVEPGDMGTISFVTEVAGDEELEVKTVLIRPKVDGNHLLRRPIYVYYKVIEEEILVVHTPPTVPEGEIKTGSGKEGDVRVKISFSGEPEITADGSFEIYSGDDFITALDENETAKVQLSNSKYRVETDGNTYTKTDPIRFVPKNDTILRIDNFEHQPAWNPVLNDNEYRGILEIQEVDGMLTVINELPLEEYLKGLGEVSNSEKTEKIKAIMVAARSYAKYYMDIDEKFPGKPYHLDDDPNVCQKYLGYGFEQRAPNVAAGVEATRGQMVTYEEEIVKTPYFNQSDGSYTKTALEVWSWDAPYLVSVSDSYCNGDQFLGHGVGMSGCGARGMAEQGYNYVEILKHYYTGVEITDFY